MQDQIENTDTDELLKFERLSNDWWDPNGSLKTLHIINPLRLAYIDDAVSLQGKKVLDLGCGGGLLAEAMVMEGAQVTGLDANASVISVARQHADESLCQIDYVVATAEQYAVESNENYDLITCMELIEHVPDPGSLFSACAALLRPGGDLIIASLNRNTLSYASAILAAEYILGLLPKGTHDFTKFIKPSEIAGYLRDLDIDVVDISGMHYLPFADRAFLNKDPSVNYLLHGRKRV